MIKDGLHDEKKRGYLSVPPFASRAKKGVMPFLSEYYRHFNYSFDELHEV